MIRKYCLIFAVIAVLLVVFLLFCDVYLGGVKYNGENPELYTVAINNFLGSFGSGSNGEITISSKTGIIDTDSYGRVLFYYHEGIIAEGCGYGISQKSQDGYVYFYEDDCVIPAADDWNYREVTHEEWFTQGEIAEFKVRNDWDQPLNEEKCTKKQIIKKKPESKLKLEKEDFVKAINAYFFEQNGKPYFIQHSRSLGDFFIADDYGREIYVLRGDVEIPTSAKTDVDVIILFNPDGSCDPEVAVAEIPDFLNYREFLKEFKQRNGWNTEYVSDNT